MKKALVIPLDDEELLDLGWDSTSAGSSPGD